MGAADAVAVAVAVDRASRGDDVLLAVDDAVAEADAVDDAV